MNTDDETSDLTNDDEYSQSLLLDDMESLLEEIEDLEGNQLPSELRERMVELGIESVAALRSHILTLHERLDSV